jgi:preprotein translocase subunit YajC
MLFALHFLVGQGDAPAGQQSSALITFLPFILIAVVFYLLLMRPMRKQQKEQQAMLGALKKNDKVITSGGMIGKVAEIKDDEVALKVDESSNVRIRVTKSSIARVLRDSEPAKEQKEGAG